MSLTGRQLGDFLLGDKLGAGGMGEVYSARQLSLDRIVAVKVLPRSLAAQEGFEDRFRREARAAANLIHPNVIQVYFAGIDPEAQTPYFAMEFVDGEDLQQRMRRLGRLPIEKSVELMTGVASALACAYEKSIVHRDIKPSNIMIDRSEIVKVMDFGLAKMVGEDAEGAASSSITKTGIIMGTPNYISPEQGRGIPIDCRSDIYSLGVVFFELLTGALPFTAETPALVIYKHVYEAPPPPRTVAPDVPPFLEEVCLRMIAKEAKDRYPNPKALLADLNEFRRHPDHYLQGGARRTPVIGSGTLSGDDTLATSGEFPGRPGAGSRSSQQTAGFAQAATVPEVAPGGAAAGQPRRFALPLAIGLGVVALVGIGLAVASGWGAGKSAVTGTGAGTGAGAGAGGKVTFAASKLESALPRGVEAFLQQGFEQKPIALVDVELDPGSYNLVFRRPHYELARQTFSIGPEGVAPPLDGFRIEWRPAEELRRNVESAKHAISERKYREAKALLADVVDKAPDYEEAARTLGTAKKLESQLDAEYRAAHRLYNEHRWAEAIEAIRALPPTVDQPETLAGMIASAELSIQRLKEQRAAFEPLLADGLFAEAGVTLEEVEKLSVARDPEVAALRERMARAVLAFEAGRTAFESGRFREAAERLDALLAISPNHREGGRLKTQARAEMDARLSAAQQVAAAIEAGEKALGLAQHEVAAAEARRALAVEPANKLAQDLLARALAKAAEAAIVRRIGRLDEAFRTLGAGSPEKRAYAVFELFDAGVQQALKADLDAFAAEPIEVRECAHRDFDVKIGPTGERAEVEATWDLVLGFPEAEGAEPPAKGRVTKLSIRQRFGARRAGEAWVFTNVEQIGKPNVQ